jgi:hypothetical protein
MRQSDDLLQRLTPRPYRPDPAHIRFCNARRASHLALMDWLQTRPDPDDVDDEVAGSIATLRQLVRLSRAGGVV